MINGTMTPRSTSAPTTLPMIAAVGILVLVPSLELGVEVAEVVEVVEVVVDVDVLDGSKACVKVAEDSYPVPPTTCNTSIESRRTLLDSEL